MRDRQIAVAIAAPLTAEAAELLRKAVESRHDVSLRHRPDLLSPQRFPGDHSGVAGFARTTEQESEFMNMLADADVILGIPGDDKHGVGILAAVATRLRWLQGTAAGVGQLVASASPSWVSAQPPAITSSAGVHGQSLAEFAITGALALLKDLDRLRTLQSAQEWPDRWMMRQLGGCRVTVLGAGGIGSRTAELARAFGAQVTAVNRTGDRTLDDLSVVLPHTDVLISCLPSTPATRRVLDVVALALLPRGAVFVNVGRGDVVDTAALVDALRSGHLRGAALDVTDPEPLPVGHPLWDFENVIISPHTAALTDQEDPLIVSLFVDNLDRFLGGEPLRNLVDDAQGY